MSTVNPQANIDNLELMAIGAVLLGFSSATQDIVIDAYRIESSDKNMQSMLSATYIAGYRIGMLVAGAGGLFLASYFGSTKN
jgi:PAT family beta-lactamase induction signal transducer AmpG